MMKQFCAAAILFAAAGFQSFGADINLSTGLDSSNQLITTGGVNDAHWTVDA